MQIEAQDVNLFGNTNGEKKGKERRGRDRERGEEKYPFIAPILKTIQWAAWGLSDPWCFFLSFHPFFSFSGLTQINEIGEG